MNISAKEKLINNFNHFLETEIIPNKLQIIMEYEGASEIDFDKLKVIDVYFGKAETHGDSIAYTEYDTIDFVFDLGFKEVELSTTSYNTFGGIFPLTDYDIFHDSYDGTQLRKSHEDGFEDCGLHLALNDYQNNTGKLYDDSLFDEFESEVIAEQPEIISKAKECFPGLIKIEAISLERVRFYFSTGIDIAVKIDEVKEAICTYNKKTKNK